MAIKGYKVFNPDWTCRGFQYEVGKTYEENGLLTLCNNGFHFCEKAADCFGYYPFNPDNKVAEVIALGEVESDGTKSCTNKIQIVREIPWGELLEIVNTGKGCTGLCNSGDCNSGNWNSGNWNIGHYNSGNRNSGNRNSGDWNSGNWNSGDWNKCSFSSGCFNTESPKIYLFNKPSEWTYEDWLESKARYLLSRLPGDALEYIRFDDMTDKEKAAHPEAETTGGYLKMTNGRCKAQEWYDTLTDDDKNIIKSIPNFDKEIFMEITGIDVDNRGKNNTSAQHSAK